MTTIDEIIIELKINPKLTDFLIELSKSKFLTKNAILIADKYINARWNYHRTDIEDIICTLNKLQLIEIIDKWVTDEHEQKWGLLLVIPTLLGKVIIEPSIKYKKTVDEIVVELEKNTKLINFLINMSKSEIKENMVYVAYKYEEHIGWSKWKYYSNDTIDVIYTLIKLRLIEFGTNKHSVFELGIYDDLFVFPTNLGKLVIGHLLNCKETYNLGVEINKPPYCIYS